MLKFFIFVPWLLLAAFSLNPMNSETELMVDPLLLAGRFYRLTLPSYAYNISAVIEAAKGAGFSVRIAEGTNVTYFLGTTPCPTCRPEKEHEFFKFPHLFIDGTLFWLRAEEMLSRYNVRPAAPAGGTCPCRQNYELIIAPKTTVSASAALNEIGLKLTRLGVVGDPVLPLNNIEELTVVPGSKLPKPPEGVRLDSVLYGLMLMPDWYEFAPQARLELWGLRVRVIVELINPEAQLAATHNLIVEARSPSGLMRVLVPIHQLVALASDPAVKLVRPPFQPGL